MNAFVFLYPIKPYVDGELRRIGFDKYGVDAFGWDPAWINTVIHERYRRRGYRVFWLLFGKENDPYLPEMEVWSPLFLRHRDDRVISAGVSYGVEQSFQYADPKYVLEQIDPAEVIRLGGFHCSDCVDRLGEALYSFGRDVLVDEDTTDYFFRFMLAGFVPAIRSVPYDPEWDPTSPSVQYGREQRRKKPWLEQY